MFPEWECDGETLYAECFDSLIDIGCSRSHVVELMRAEWETKHLASFIASDGKQDGYSTTCAIVGPLKNLYAILSHID